VNVLVLGAGGAARAVIAGLLGRRCEPYRDRQSDRGTRAALAGHFGEKVSALPWAAIPRHLPVCDLVVNATLLGMAGQPPLEIDLDGLPPGAAVADIVYVPLETDLLRQARGRGHPVIDGLGMLLHQAVPGFEVWFGVRPEVTPQLRAVIEADLAG
jgi:shikimate dehydrogenase